MGVTAVVGLLPVLLVPDLALLARGNADLTSMLRAGSAVVAVWNDAFDLDGVPPERGTTVPGVRRTLKADSTAAHQRLGEQRSEVAP